MKEQTKVFLVDDHKLLRDTLRMFLENCEEIEVVGEAGNGADAVKGILDLKPELVLMDLTLPDFDGVEATVQIVKALPKIKVIAVTMHPEKLYLLKFLEAGGVGYVHKSAADRELLQAIERVQQGEVFLSPEGVQVMAGQFRTQNVSLPKEEAKKDRPPDILSARERQVLGLLSHGYSCREIGERLFLSTSTIETYKKRVTDKLNLTNRKDLVEYTIRHKIFEGL
ncbi:LuxR family transcriptional regulator [Desulfitobacterium hafniense]|uniref:Stage 0 sporulation protein A homolog n=1 Tax=Desulfitobacterium hafniense TaxID=49338 RepID=A0A0W1JME0_DESHA|nr:response regulator transcription factor [Desulfitobacterium hafniense]KTE92430.1 LuxR family transcriptional regulator [Desulfitobacterium hafniense]